MTDDAWFDVLDVELRLVAKKLVNGETTRQYELARACLVRKWLRDGDALFNLVVPAPPDEENR